MRVSREQAVEALSFVIIALSVYGMAKAVLVRADFGVQTGALASMSSGWLDAFNVPYTRELHGGVETIVFQTAEGTTMYVGLTMACAGADLMAAMVGLFVAASHLKIQQKIRGILLSIVVVFLINPLRVASFIWMARSVGESAGSMFHALVFPLSIIISSILIFSQYEKLERGAFKAAAEIRKRLKLKIKSSPELSPARRSHRTRSDGSRRQPARD